MSLYAIGDLHLSLGTDKPMDVFGGEWIDYVEKIRKGFQHINDDDTVVLCGDISWGKSLYESAEDFRFISSLPGRKILIKGNHDYWWGTAAKMRSFFNQNDFENIEILHNNCIIYENAAICGTRGWFFEEDFKEGHDEKVYRRELLRLETSLEAGKSSGCGRIMAFLHYPPIYSDYECRDILNLLQDYQAEVCCFGHLHGYSHRKAVTGLIGGVEYKLVSADFINFTPIKII